MSKINVDVFLLISRENEYSKESINCLNKVITKKNINLHISTTDHIFNKFSDYINQEKIKIILNKRRFDTIFDHMLNLAQFSEAKYISFIHDDDIFDPKFLINSFDYLCKYKPIALSNRCQIIDKFSNKAYRRNHKPEKKIISLSKNRILSRYFLPFERPVDTPTIIYDKSTLISYGKKYPLRNLSIFEDARISFFFASKGKFLENQESNLYFWRISDLNLSNLRKNNDRLRLIAWMQNLSINRYFKFILVLGAKLQFFFFYQESYGNSKLNQIFFGLRDRLIKYRSGF